MYKRIAADTDLAMPKGTRIYGARLESAAADVYAILYDDLTQSDGNTNGRQICTLFVTNTVGDGATGSGTQDIHPNSDKQMFGPLGITLERGLSVTLDGTGAVLYIYYA